MARKRSEMASGGPLRDAVYYRLLSLFPPAGCVLGEDYGILERPKTWPLPLDEDMQRNFRY